MRFFNWAQAFKETPTCDDILKRVRKTEVIYWIFQIVSVIIVISGVNLIQNAPENNIKEHTWGLFIAIVGIIQIAVIKLWAQIRLTMFFTIWERNNWVQSEIRKSEAHDI